MSARPPIRILKAKEDTDRDYVSTEAKTPILIRLYSHRMEAQVVVL